jgi:hypothetical protein
MKSPRDGTSALETVTKTRVKYGCARVFSLRRDRWCNASHPHCARFLMHQRATATTRIEIRRPTIGDDINFTGV